MTWLLGFLLAFLFSLFLWLITPIDWREQLLPWLRRRLQRPETKARHWKEEQVPDPEDRQQSWQQRSQEILQRLLRTKTQEQVPPPPKAPPKRQAPPKNIFYLILAITVVVGGLFLLSTYLDRHGMPQRAHRLTIGIADLSMDETMSPSRAGTVAGQDLLVALEEALEEHDLTETVRLRLVSTVPQDAGEAQALARRSHADLLLWGWVQQEDPPGYVLTLTVNPQWDKEVPEFKEYFQVMLTPAQFSLNQAGSEQGLPQNEIVQTMMWLAHFYLGEFDRVEQQHPNAIPATVLSREVLFFHWAALQWLQGNYAEAQSGYDLLFEAKTPRGCHEQNPNALCIAASNNQAVVLLTREAIGELGPAVLDQAIGLFQQTTGLLPKNLVAQYNLGRAYLVRGKWTEAVDVLNEVVKQDRRNAAALAALSEAYRRQGKLKEAKQQADAAIKADQSLAEAYLALGRYFLDNKDLKTAANELDRALEMAQVEGRRRRSWGTALRENPQANPRRAAYAFAWADRTDPTFAEVYLAHSQLYLLLGKDEGDPSIFVFLWRALTRQPDPMDRALDEVDEALKKHRDWYEAFYLQGQIYLVQKMPGEAASSFAKAKLQDPTQVKAYTGLAQALQQEWKDLRDTGQEEDAQKKLEQARQEYLLLVTLYIAPAQGYFGLGEIEQELEQWEQARVEFQLAVDADPSYAQAYLNLGLVESELGLEDAALENFDRAILNATGQPGIKLLAHMERGAIFTEQYLVGKIDQYPDTRLLTLAQNEFKEAKSLDSDAPGPLNGLGRVDYEKDNLVQAQTFFEKAFNLQRNNFDTLYGLGLVNLAQKKSRPALEYFERAQALRPHSIAANYYLGVASYAQLYQDRAQGAFERTKELCQDQPEQEHRADDRDSCQKVDSRLEEISTSAP